MANCNKCKHVKLITGDNQARCIKHGMSVLVDRFLKITDKQKLKAIKLEMRFK